MTTEKQDAKKIDFLLTGGHLLKEIPSEDPLARTWFEICIDESGIKKYPFRLPPHAMLQNSPYFPKEDLQSAVFRLRKSSFPAFDIENQFDPPFDKVGKYRDFNNFNDLLLELQYENVRFDDFIDAALDDEYPL